MSGDDGPFLRLSAAIEAPPDSPLRIYLLQGISRGERMDLVIQKATELGVTEIRPVETRRSVVRLDPRRARRRLDHWRGVVVAACEQCGRARLPAMSPPTSLEDALGALPGDATRWLLDADGEAPCAATAVGTGGIVLLVGPEGGLTGAEKVQAVDRGFAPLRLGPRIMRTETAAIAAMVIAQALWGDLSASR
jgi:16S rRNA (uracil1498-N3)-methyltransferase